MMEKIYKTMKSVGVWNMVLGIVLIVAGLFAGIFMIVNGTRLLKKSQTYCFKIKEITLDENKGFPLRFR